VAAIAVKTDVVKTDAEAAARKKTKPVADAVATIDFLSAKPLNCIKYFNGYE